MQQQLPLLLPQVREPLVEQRELDGVEEVGLARPVPTDDDIVSGAEGLDLGLCPEAAEARHGHLLDVHLLAAPFPSVLILLFFFLGKVLPYSIVPGCMG